MAHQWIQGPPVAADEADRRLFFKVRNALWDYEPLRASGAQLTIDVEHQTVHVSGRVRSTAQKQLISALLGRLPGVLGVHNGIVADPEVARDVALALARDPAIAPHVIQVNSELGQVTLFGSVPSDSLAERAIEIAHNLGVVHSVQSGLLITQAPVGAGA
ncbi:MAG: BON domain-containing protein [Chloroflexota bacterium]